MSLAIRVLIVLCLIALALSVHWRSPLATLTPQDIVVTILVIPALLGVYKVTGFAVSRALAAKSAWSKVGFAVATLGLVFGLAALPQFITGPAHIIYCASEAIQWGVIMALLSIRAPDLTTQAG